VEPWLGWWFGKWGFALWLCVVFSGLLTVWRHWQRFWETSSSLWVPDTWLWLALGWTALKIIHESCHGLACKRAGGFVREAGVGFMFLVPMAYVDVTSAWRFSSRLQRMMVSAGGIYGELFVAGLAAYAWPWTSPGITQVMICQMVVLGSIVTLAVNANPLLRFDGYFLLMDGLNLPNLHAKGQRAVREFVFTQVLGFAKLPAPLQGVTAWYVSAYGWLSLIYRCFVSVSVVVVAACLWRGAGLLLAGPAVVAWYVAPGRRFLLEVAERWSSQRSRRPIVARAGCFATVLVLLLSLVPTPQRFLAPGSVDYSPLTVLRAPTAGVVQQMLVDEDDDVEIGQPLVAMSDDELELNCGHVQRFIDEYRIRERMARVAGHLAAAIAHRKTLEELEKQLYEQHALRDALLVRAPHSGRIVDCKPGEISGCHVAEGRELLCLGNEDRKEVRAVLREADFPTIQQRIGQRVSLRCEDGRWFDACGVLAMVLPYASKEPPSPNLSAAHGGRLSVTKSPADANQAAGQARAVLTEPQFVMIIALDAETSTSLKAGHTGQIFVAGSPQSLGIRLWQHIRDWMSDLRQLADWRSRISI
jgi:putative peptide zinc metalloprotease protein